MSVNDVELSDIIALVLVIVTGVYVFITWRMQAHASRVYISERAPVISVRVTVRHSVMLYLTIENLGRTPARNLSLSMDRDFIQFAQPGGSNVREFDAFNTPITQFGPKEKLSFALSQGFNLDTVVDERNLTPKTFKILVSYDYEGQKEEFKVNIDLKPFMHTVHPKSIEERLEDIEVHLKKMAAK